MKKNLARIIACIGFTASFVSAVNAQWIQTSVLSVGGNISALTVSGSNIFAGTWGAGIFLSTNNGTSWTEVNSGLTNSYVNCFAVSGTNIFAGTQGGGVWRRPLSEMVSIIPKNQKAIHLQTSLSIAGSSSLHSGILLSYNIQSRCVVQLDIYTISGKQVAVLEHGIRNPGNYRINFGNDRNSAGLYEIGR